MYYIPIYVFMAQRENIYVTGALAVLCIECSSQARSEVPLDAVLCVGRTDSKG